MYISLKTVGLTTIITVCLCGSPIVWADNHGGGHGGHGEYSGHDGYGGHHENFSFGVYPYYPYSGVYVYPGYSYPYVVRETHYKNSPTTLLNVQVQQQLADLGYYHDTIDGVVGPQTRQALMMYQRDYGLNINGNVDAATMQSLGVLTPAAQD